MIVDWFCELLGKCSFCYCSYGLEIVFVVIFIVGLGL